MKNITKIEKEENFLQGTILFKNGKIELDDTGKRIEYLITYYLKKIKSDESGWLTLYQDPSDCRYWELSYPESELQGGGAPKLQEIDKNDVIQKYAI